MKTYQLFLAAAVLLQLSACDRAREFLPGTYINSARGRLSMADDTLVLEAAGNNSFLLHRRTCFNLIDNGKTGKRQYETEEWRAIYDESTKTLTEIRKGKLISIYPDSGYMLIGKRKYTKK